MSVSSRFLGALAVLSAVGIMLPAASTARPGDLVPDFGTGGLSITAPDPEGREAPADMEQLTDGSLLVAGSAGSGSGSLLIKYRPDGSLDLDFGNQGKVRGNGPGWQQVELLADGRILLAGGRGTELAFQRLDADGNPDPGFGGTGQVNLDASGLSYLPEDLAPDAEVTSLRTLADGGIRAIGSFAGCQRQGGFCASAFMAGLDQDGDPGNGFGASGIRDLNIQGRGILSTTFVDGRSLVFRIYGEAGEWGRIFAVPISDSGDPGQETYLAYSSEADSKLGSIGVDPSGRVLLTDGRYLRKLHPDGDLVESFGNGGRVDYRDLTRFIPGHPYFRITDLTVDGKGRILLSGGSRHDKSRETGADTWASSGVVARLKADGSVDSSFGQGGITFAWPGVRAGRGLAGRTSILAEGSSVALAGMGPVDGSFGFTLARLENGQMKLPRCNGKTVDLVGTPGADQVEAHMSVVATLGGDDVVTGGYKATICTGAGNDSVSLEQGHAKVFGGPGRDLIRLRNKKNDAHGGPGDDRIFGGRGDDRLHGDAGDDLIRGGQRDDRIFGGPGNDRLYGESGRDQLFGGPGRDLLRVGPRGPNLTEYLSRKPGQFLRVVTRGRKATASVRVRYVCSGNVKQTGLVTVNKIPFNPSTGHLKQIYGRPGNIDAADFNARARGKRLSGVYRVIDDGEYSSDGTCRTGKGPFRVKTILRDAWVKFSAKRVPKPRQFARQ